MASIDKKLALWEQHGLISPDQLDEILAFEQGTSNKPNNWWLYSLLILGVAIIGLGVISLIAANWAYIPELTKLGVAFSLLTTLATAIVWQYSRSNSHWFDALIMGFMVLCLATIGLIAQIYHIQGKLYYALLLWSAITFPLALFARHLLVHFFWFSLFLNSFIWSSVALSGAELLSLLRSIPALLLLAALSSAFFYMLSKRLGYLNRFTSSSIFWFQIFAIIALAAIDLIRSGGDSQTFNATWYFPAWVMAIALCTLIITRKDYKTLSKAVLVGATLLLLLYYHPSILFSGETRYHFISDETTAAVSIWRADDIRAPLLTTFILLLYAIHAGITRHQHTFNLMTFLIGLRFLVLYFQAMGGLAATGIGLILSGLMIIGIAWFWYSSRERLHVWMQRLNV